MSLANTTLVNQEDNILIIQIYFCDFYNSPLDQYNFIRVKLFFLKKPVILNKSATYYLCIFSTHIKGQRFC